MTDANAALPTQEFDLSDFKALDEGHLNIQLNGKLTGWIWTFAGPGHPRSVAYSDRMSRERLHRDRVKEQAQVNGKKWKAPDLNLDEVRAENVNFILERLLSWSAFKLDKEVFPFSTENARNILTNPSFQTLFTQALEFLTDDNSFTKRSETT